MEELEKNVLKVFNSTKSDFTNYLDAKEIILKEIKKTDDLESLLFFCYDLIKYEDDEEIINDFNKVIEKIEKILLI